MGLCPADKGGKRKARMAARIKKENDEEPEMDCKHLETGSWSDVSNLPRTTKKCK
jgi:hypothetical protein